MSISEMVFLQCVAFKNKLINTTAFLCPVYDGENKVDDKQLSLYYCRKFLHYRSHMNSVCSLESVQLMIAHQLPPFAVQKMKRYKAGLKHDFAKGYQNR